MIFEKRDIKVTLCQTKAINQQNSDFNHAKYLIEKKMFQ